VTVVHFPEPRPNGLPPPDDEWNPSDKDAPDAPPSESGAGVRPETQQKPPPELFGGRFRFLSDTDAELLNTKPPPRQ
jgi:hypothetical protein